MAGRFGLRKLVFFASVLNLTVSAAPNQARR
jgi:hypothetical protein